MAQWSYWTQTVQLGGCSIANLSEVIFKRKHNINSTSWIVQSAVVMTVMSVKREELQTKSNKSFHNFHIIAGSVFNNHWGEKSLLGASKNEFNSSEVLSKFFFFASFNRVKVWTATEGRPNPARNMWNNKWKVTWRRGKREWVLRNERERDVWSSWVSVGHPMLDKKRKKRDTIKAWGLGTLEPLQVPSLSEAFQTLPVVYLF